MTGGTAEYWEIGPEAAGLRLDKALAQRWPQCSRAYFQGCIEGGAVTVNGAVERASRRLECGDRIVLTWPRQEIDGVQAMDIPLDVLYEDEDLLVVNKPAGLVVHPGAGNQDGTLVSALLFREPEVFSSFSDREYRPGIVHRLDKDTSGVLLVARNVTAWQRLKESFREHEVAKLYLTVVRGSLAARTGTVEAPIGRSAVNRLKMAVTPNGRAALTKYRLLAERDGYSLLLVRLYTGRTHQIRVHMAHVGHPVAGDQLYGGRNVPGIPFAAPSQLLHAWKIAFPHPADRRPLDFTAPLPPLMRSAVEFFAPNADLDGLLT